MLFRKYVNTNSRSNAIIENKKCGDKMKSFIKMILQVIRRIDYIVLYCLCRIVYPINNQQVLFLSDSREDMTGNFYFIYEKIKYDYVVKKYLGNHKHYSKFLICKDMATSHYILVDDFYPLIYPIPLRKKTRLIQVWHAVGAFKTVGFARKHNQDHFSMTHRNYTDAIVSSSSIRKDYAQAFRMNEEDIHSTGIPRTDIFFDKSYIEKKKEELYKKYPLLKDKTVILFAPTFRGNNIHQAYYDFDKIDFEQLQSQLSNDYIFIIKMHPFIQNTYSQQLDSSFYLDLTSEREINDLLLITDILITDYSSVIFEASLLNIYTIFYAYDLEEYISLRDFFYSYEKYTFGPIVKNQEQLQDAILHPQKDDNKLKDFHDYFMSSCDGHASERFVETLLKEKI